MLGSNDHRTCRKLLPWYVNGTLEAAELAAVERHLEGCDACREELASLEDLRHQVRATRDESPAVPTPFATARGLHQTLERIDGDTRARFHTPPAVRWALVAQAAAILLLASLLLWPSTPEALETFRTLSDPPTVVEPGGEQQLRVVFRDDATEIELRRLLRSVQAEIVGGPSSVGAYTLRLEERLERESEGAGVLETLRGDPAVRFAELIAPR